jgi:serine/threonine protein kinase
MNYNIVKNKFNEQFTEKILISSGGQGIIYKVLNKLNKKFEAIKLIPFNKNDIQKVLREVEISRNLKECFVVKFKSYWIERNYISQLDFMKNKEISSSHQVFNVKNELLLHIHMELCSQNLKDFLKEIYSIFNQKDSERFEKLRYFVVCQIFIEILEGVKYLHENNPAIIHRDLKPSNIMVCEGANDRFIKIADFGLATYHTFDDQSHTTSLGTPGYIAPEILMSKKYTTKADIYSLGVMMGVMFNIDVNK